MTENRCNYTKSYYFFQMGRLKVCTIFSTIFAVLGFPLISLLFTIDESDFSVDPNILLPLLFLGIVCVLGTCAMSYITPILAYRHLFTKTNADNILSLPLTANQRFLADTLATYTSYAFPYLVSCLLSLLVLLAAGPESNAESITKYHIIGFFLLITFSALNTAVITCCGRIVEAILYPIAINVVMPLICGIAIQISYTDCVGINIYSDDLFRNPALRIWPFGNAFGAMYADSVAIYIYAVIMTAVFLGAAYFGYTRRHAENIGKSFVFRYSYVIASSLIAVALVFGYTLILDMEPAKGNIGTILPLAIILFILMLIMEIINYKKIMSVIKFLLRYAAILVGGVAACILFSKTGGFGAENFIPSTGSIVNVTIGYYKYGSGTQSRSEVTVKSEDMVNLVRNEHKAAIEKAKQSDNVANQQISIEYVLKTGEIVSRNYDLSMSAEAFSPDFWQKMYQSADYSLEKINNIYDNYYLSQIDHVTVQLRNYHSSKVYIEYDETDKNKLIKALEKDLLADKNFGRHDEAPVGILSVGYNEREIDEIQAYATNLMTSYAGFHSVADFTIYESYTNTIALLKEQGTVPTPDEALDDSVKNCEVFMLYRTLKSDSKYPATEIYNRDEAAAIFITAEEFKELASHHVKYTLPAETENEYNYHVVRGIWNDLAYRNYYTPFGYVIGLEEIGYPPYTSEEYEFLEDEQIYYKDTNYESDLNESVNEYCDALFAERTQFSYYN